MKKEKNIAKYCKRKAEGRQNGGECGVIFCDCGSPFCLAQSVAVDDAPGQTRIV